MATTTDLRRLDEAHSVLISFTEQGDCAAVLSTVASVLSKVPSLDKPSNDPHYWEAVIRSLHALADELQDAELEDDTLSGDLWDDADAGFLQEELEDES